MDGSGLLWIKMINKLPFALFCKQKSNFTNFRVSEPECSNSISVYSRKDLTPLWVISSMILALSFYIVSKIGSLCTGYFLSDQLFCHQLIQNTMTDFDGPSEIYKNCSAFQNTTFVSFEFQNAWCNSS